MKSGRKPIVAGNWKMYKTTGEATKLINALKQEINTCQGVEVLVCPPFTALADAFGFGTNPPPLVILGTLQSQGVMIGMGVIILGLLMMIRWDRDRSHPIVKNCSNIEKIEHK